MSRAGFGATVFFVGFLITLLSGSKITMTIQRTAFSLGGFSETAQDMLQQDIEFNNQLIYGSGGANLRTEGRSSAELTLGEKGGAVVMLIGLALWVAGAWLRRPAT